MRYLPLILSALFLYSIALAATVYDWGARDGAISGFRQGMTVSQFNYPTRCARFDR